MVHEKEIKEGEIKTHLEPDLRGEMWGGKNAKKKVKKLLKNSKKTL